MCFLSLHTHVIAKHTHMKRVDTHTSQTKPILTHTHTHIKVHTQTYIHALNKSMHCKTAFYL